RGGSQSPRRSGTGPHPPGAPENRLAHRGAKRGSGTPGSQPQHTSRPDPEIRHSPPIKEPGKRNFAQSTPGTRLCARALQRAGAKEKQPVIRLYPFTPLVWVFISINPTTILEHHSSLKSFSSGDATDKR